jgi:hypothetical protein
MADREAWKELYAYWLSKHVDGRPPTRRELDPPIEVPRLIANVMLIDVIDGNRFRYRLVGSAVWDRYGFELTGTWIEGRVPAEAEWRDTLQAVHNDRAARLITSPVTDHPERLHIAIALPLSDGQGGVGQILAATYFARDLADNPSIGRLTVREIWEGLPDPGARKPRGFSERDILDFSASAGDEARCRGR